MSTKLISFVATSDNELWQQVGIIKFLAHTENLAAFNPEGIELQVFRTTKGIRYRVLEAGYGLKNRMWRYLNFFPQCNYDDRTDIPEEDLPNKAMADQIDWLIETHQYSIIVIVEAKK